MAAKGIINGVDTDALFETIDAIQGIYHAAARGKTIRSIEARLEGEIDLHGFLGLREDVRNGYESIRIVYDIDADATPEEIEEMVRMGQARSPVYDCFTNGVPVKVSAASAATTA